MTEIIERLAGRRVVASISGGKDSTAAALSLRERGIDFELATINTGWEERRWREYVFGPLQKLLGPIKELRAEIPLSDDELCAIHAAAHDCPLVIEWLWSPMVRLCLSKKMFPGRKTRFCTDHLKFAAIKSYLDSLDDDAVSVVGVRAAESTARARLTEWEWSPGLDCWVWRPIFEWSLDDVIEIHRRHGVTPNPLYLEDHPRVGCWPCVEASKAEVRLISLKDRERIELIRQLERVVQRLAKWEMRARGEKLKHRRTFFQALGKYNGHHPSIDEVTRWAQTVRGGKEEDRQELLFGGSMNDGCMKWGLCDTGSQHLSGTKKKESECASESA